MSTTYNFEFRKSVKIFTKFGSTKITFDSTQIQTENLSVKLPHVRQTNYYVPAHSMIC